MHTFPKAIKWKNFELNFDRTLIMGVLNVTPDSFSDGGLYLDHKKAVSHARKMVEEGADIIDIGGESTRPGSDTVSADEELKRIVPVIKELANKIKVPISVDTYKPKVASKCLELGASIVNDITALSDKGMIHAIKKFDAPVILMHMKGKPKSMQENPSYKNVTEEIKYFLERKIILARKSGIRDVLIDPGIGFGKTLEHNLRILKDLNAFTKLKCPIVIGTSKKSFIGKLTNLPLDERLEGTIASIVIAATNGANIVRVHNVKEGKRALLIADAIKGA